MKKILSLVAITSIFTGTLFAAPLSETRGLPADADNLAHLDFDALRGSELYKQIEALKLDYHASLKQSVSNLSKEDEVYLKELLGKFSDFTFAGNSNSRYATIILRGNFSQEEFEKLLKIINLKVKKKKILGVTCYKVDADEKESFSSELPDKFQKTIVAFVPGTPNRLIFAENESGENKLASITQAIENYKNNRSAPIPESIKGLIKNSPVLVAHICGVDENFKTADAVVVEKNKDVEIKITNKFVSDSAALEAENGLKFMTAFLAMALSSPSEDETPSEKMLKTEGLQILNALKVSRLKDTLDISLKYPSKNLVTLLKKIIENPKEK